MVGAVQRVEEKEQPEAKHGEEMAVNRPAGGGGDHEVDDGQREGRDEKANRIMYPEAAERGTAGSGEEFRDEVAHWICQQGEHQAPDDVPAGDVEMFEAARKEWWQELDGGEEEGEDDKTVNDERKLGPFEGLAEAGENQNPTRDHHDEIPEAKEPLAQFEVGDRPTRQDRHGVIEEGKEGVAKPAKHDPLGMVVAEPAPGQQGRTASQLGDHEFRSGPKTKTG